MTAFLQRVRDRRPPGAEAVKDFHSLYRWSVARPDAFWPEVWDFCGVVADPWNEVVVGLERMAPPDPALGPRWFTGARLNFAENLLRFADEREALVFWNEQGRQRALTYRELGDAVAAVARALRAHGIQPGDRVAGFLPNLPETVIAMLATASLGAIWSSCSPDFGANGVLDRFGQIEPRILFCADGYRYAGKAIDSLARVREVCERIPAIERVVVVPYLSETAGLVGDSRSCGVGGVGGGRSGGRAVGGLREAEATARPPDRPTVVRLPFDHPLYIMYSSGTTGLPKCMVHGAGGTLLQHLKELVLHTDLTPRRSHLLLHHLRLDDVELAGLQPRRRCDGGAVRRGAAGAGVASCGTWRSGSGSPSSGPARSTWRWRRRRGCEPARTHDLSALRAILSTGSPLAAQRVRLRLPRRQGGRPSREHQRRHRHHLLFRSRQSDRSGLAGRAADARAGDGGRGVRRGWAPRARSGR